MKSEFLDAVKADMRLRGYSIRTEKTYLTWIRRYINFNERKHPLEIPTTRIKDFLTWLADIRKVSPNTQKVALNALVYLYAKYLNLEIGELGFQLATRKRYIPTVLTLKKFHEFLII